MAFPKIEGYVVTEKLGSGSYSTVYKAYNKVGGRSTVAIKCVDKSRVKQSGSAVDNLISEIRLMKTLRHPHIVRMHNFTWDDMNIYIIMEYCSGGDLSKYIHRYGRLPEKQVLVLTPHLCTYGCPQVRYFLQQLASALKFLYEKGIVHMDLKPHNLLLHKGSDNKYILKVADFGFAQHMSAEWRGVRGSPLYMAPEMISGECGPAVDLWSVGVILYECLFGKAPYSSNTFKELVDKIQRQAPIQIPPHSSISADCRSLLHSLLQHDPLKRINYEQFFAHRYLDLEHMPSPENYEKAVFLIKQAIELDAAGRLEPAFEAYKESLLYLVPCAASELDAVRRAALSDKLTRYMERAEEIKLHLKGGPSSHASHDSQDSASEGVCNAPDRDGSRRDAPPVPAAPPAGAAAPAPAPPAGAAAPAPAPPASAALQVPSTRPRARAPARRGLKRLFARPPAPPFLDDEDSAASSEPRQAEKPQKEPSDNDACRIT